MGIHRALSPIYVVCPFVLLYFQALILFVSFLFFFPSFSFFSVCFLRSQALLHIFVRSSELPSEFSPPFRFVSSLLLSLYFLIFRSSSGSHSLFRSLFFQLMLLPFFFCWLCFCFSFFSLLGSYSLFRSFF